MDTQQPASLLRPQAPRPDGGDSIETDAHGTVWTIRHGGFVARIAQAGAALLGLRRGEHWLTEPTPLDSAPAAGNGQLLVPWPNRVRDGRYSLGDQTLQLGLTEPARHNASHGLLRSAEYRTVSRTEAALTVTARIFPTSGYPFRVDHTVRFELSENGLQVAHELAHRGAPDAPAAPVAIGAHPYLRVGEVPVAECRLQIPGASWLVTDDQLIPVAARPVDAEHDWRTPRVIGSARPDTCWSDLAAEVDGLLRYRLVAPEGSSTELWAEPVFGHVQVFVTDRLPGRQLAIAVEPMTAAPDAFNSGDGLRWLAPGETLSGSWGITCVGV